MVIKVEIKGLRELVGKFNGLNKQVQTEVRATVENGAKEWVALAKRDAPMNYGKLAQGISYKPENRSRTNYSYTIVSNSAYSPYMEWGTKGNAVVPSDQAQYASEFKGKGGGSIDEFFMAILNWVKKKGLADTYSTGIAGKGKITAKSSLRKGKRRRANDRQAFDLAFVIMMSILKKGVKPRPFFFKHRPVVQAKVERGIQGILSEIK